MSSTEKPKKVFVSYCWTSDEFQRRVIEIATELINYGIDVKLDVWDLEEGNDLYAFMESMVTDSSIDKVLMICNHKYAQRADERKGGVGTETQIISAEIYQSIDQNKFIAVVVENDEKGNACVPTYYKSKIYINLIDDENYADNFEKLLRCIYEKRLHKKPKLGKPPAFLTDTTEGQKPTGTSNYASRAVNAVKNAKNFAGGAITDYFEKFSIHLENFSIDPNSGQDIDDLIIERIDAFTPYRNEFINVLITLTKYDYISDSIDKICDFFEQTIPYMHTSMRHYSYRQWEYDGFRFMLYELYLYTLATLVKYKQFAETKQLIDYHYYHENISGDYTDKNYLLFQHYFESLDQRNKNPAKQEVSKKSLRADLLEKRCVGLPIKFVDIQQIDLILFLREAKRVLTSNNESYIYWQPDTLIYQHHYQGGFEFFQRASSTQYFQRAKDVLGVSSTTELDTLIDKLEELKLVPRWQFINVNLRQITNIDNLCSS